MKQLCCFLLIGSLIGCAGTDSLIKQKTISPTESVLCYLDRLYSLKNEQNPYSILSHTNKQTIAAAAFFKKAEKDNILDKAKVLKSAILDIDEISPVQTIVYILLVLDPRESVADNQYLVLKFHTVFEKDEWKVQLKHKTLFDLELFPIFLELNTQHFDINDLEPIRMLVKQDKEKNTPRGQVSQDDLMVKHLRPTPAEASATALKDIKLSVVQKCYQEGEQLFYQGKYGEALLQFQKVLNIDPECFNAKKYIEKCQKEL